MCKDKTRDEQSGTAADETVPEVLEMRWDVALTAGPPGKRSIMEQRRALSCTISVEQANRSKRVKRLHQMCGRVEQCTHV